MNAKPIRKMFQNHKASCHFNFGGNYCNCDKFPTEGYAVSLEPKKYDYDKMIDCAAIRTPDGRVWTGKRHGHCIKTIIQAYAMRDYASAGRTSKRIPEGCKQGFVTMSGRFVDRKEAAMIAVHAGQAELTLPCELYSEDLY